jgi:hypothetical protein
MDDMVRHRGALAKFASDAAEVVYLTDLHPVVAQGGSGH